MTQIPAQYSVKSTPSVIGAGGAALNLNGLCISNNPRIPFGQVLSFADGTDVESYFGASAQETINANGGETSAGNPAGTGYFGGYQGATQQPGQMLFARWPQTAISAWMRGGSLATMTLAQLQALSGSLTVTVDGAAHTIADISFASDNSFSSAAASMQSAFADAEDSSFTGSLGASFTATASGGDGKTFTVSGVTGYISAGDAVTGTGVPANTTIASQISGPAGGAGVYLTNQATTANSAACTSTSTVLNVTAIASGAPSVGQTVAGAGMTTATITAQLTGDPGGTGTYQLSGAAQSVASEAMTGSGGGSPPLVTFDSISSSFVITSATTGDSSTINFATGTLAASLALTSATGAILSQGSAAMTPAAFMASIVNQTVNWATFFTNFDPDDGNGNTNKLAFAAWTNSVAPRYGYIAWDTDASPTTQVPATASLGYLVNVMFQYSGTVCLYEPEDLNHAAFLSGAIAAINFNQVNGRTSMAYRTQSGLGAAVTDQLTAENLGGSPFTQGDFGNNYNFVGAFSLPNQVSVNLQRGRISGPFVWIDSYVNQIWLSNQFQVAAYNYMLAVGAFPYSPAGYANFETALQSVIDAGLTFGMYSAGVQLSSEEIVEINTQAGANIATSLQSQGYYLQVKAADPATRASRGSPPITFWYVDGGSVQSININSVAVQ